MPHPRAHLALLALNRTFIHEAQRFPRGEDVEQVVCRLAPDFDNFWCVFSGPWGEVLPRLRPSEPVLNARTLVYVREAVDPYVEGELAPQHRAPLLQTEEPHLVQAFRAGDPIQYFHRNVSLLAAPQLALGSPCGEKISTCIANCGQIDSRLLGYRVVRASTSKNSE